MVRVSHDEFLFLTRKTWRLLEPVLLGFHRPMMTFSIWEHSSKHQYTDQLFTGAHVISEITPWWVDPIKQNNWNTNLTSATCPGARYSFFCQAHCSNSNHDSLYISKGPHLQGRERLNHSTLCELSCGEASVLWIHVITQSTGDYWDKYMINQITGNQEVLEWRPANPCPGLG